jgi:glutathione S-transferase
MTDLRKLPELWQTEWCPASRRVRQRLTELGVDYVVRQVPVDRELRHTLRDAVGTETIPVLVVPGEEPLVDEEAIAAWLDAHVVEPADAEEHRAKAAKARRRYLEEECECLQPATR